jgi:hypothetical protein
MPERAPAGVPAVQRGASAVRLPLSRCPTAGSHFNQCEFPLESV